MPRVSEEHLERRRQQILDAAQLCFARKGFHETSMQDVFAESGLSAGAVYRYFKSKNDIITALATQTTLSLQTLMDDAIQHDPLLTPSELVAAVAAEVVRRSGPDGAVRLAPQAWALAVINPASGDPVRVTMLAMRDRWFQYVTRMRDAGWLPPDADLDAVTKAIICFMPGFMLQHLILGDVEPETLARGVELLIPTLPITAKAG